LALSLAKGQKIDTGIRKKGGVPSRKGKKGGRIRLGASMPPDGALLEVLAVSEGKKITERRRAKEKFAVVGSTVGVA